MSTEPLVAPPTLGAVVIGRNEGERLRRCLQSLAHASVRVVYVDSGSTDGSVALARSLGASAHALDLARPFTAARARNAGASALAQESPGLELIQFVDGDCELAPGWLAAAADFLRGRPDVAAVCGRLRERFPDASVYNLLCDLEWDTPVGSTKACGGIALMRAAAFRSAGGFREELIAGEEPELCVRLRAAGWLVWRLDAEMALHDAAMTRFGQWWMRSVRTGFAFAEGASLHGAAPERHWVRESRRAWFWGLGLPLLTLVGVGAVGPIAWVALALYPLQVLRLYLGGAGSARARRARAFFLVLGKFAEVVGQLKFLAGRLSGSRNRLIEYK
jgi:GT2 family glycosyltransferase